MTMGLGAILRRLLANPGLLLGALYAIAICFERIVEVEVFKPYRVVGLAMIGLVILRGRFRVDRFARLSILFVAIGLFLALFSIIRSGDTISILVITTVLWTFNIATYVALISLLKTRRDVLLMAMIHSVALLFSAYGIASAANAESGMAVREFGDFKNPANACISMLFAACVILALIRTRTVLRSRGWAIVRILLLFAVPAFLLYTATLTGSRAGAALLLAGILAYLYITSSRRVVLAATFLAVMAGALVWVAPVGLSNQGAALSERNVLAARIEKKGLDTARLYLWRAGMDAFLDTGGLGLGASRYQSVHREYFSQYAFKSDPRWMDSDLTLHNDYVSAVVEFGLIGFALFLLMCGQLVRTVRRIDDRHMRAIGVALLIGLAINGLTHTGLPYFAVWFYFALLSAWRFAEVREARQEDAGPPAVRVH